MTGQAQEKTRLTLAEALRAAQVGREASTAAGWFQAPVVVLYHTTKRIAGLATPAGVALQNKIFPPIAYVKTFYDYSVDDV